MRQEREVHLQRVSVRSGRLKDSTHLHRERQGGAMRRGEAGEGGDSFSRLQGPAKRGGRGRLHLRHPIHLIQLADCHILLLKHTQPEEEGGGRGGGEIRVKRDT